MTEVEAQDSPQNAPIPPADPGTGPSDSLLLRMLRRGSEDAATQLYLRYAERLRLLARNQCSAQLARCLEADDIVQSVFRTFFRRAQQGLYDVPPGDDLWKLLLVIALNKIRTKGAFHQAAKRDARLTTELGDVDPTAQVQGRQDPAYAFLEVVVEDALAQLPAPQRTMVELRVEGHEVAEIARRTGRSKRTVERLLQEARGRLSTLLREDE